VRGQTTNERNENEWQRLSMFTAGGEERENGTKRVWPVEFMPEATRSAKLMKDRERGSQGKRLAATSKVCPTKSAGSASQQNERNPLARTRRQFFFSPQTSN